MAELEMAQEDLQEQFDDLEQQQTAASLGMWVFLATEVLFFGGLLLAYIVYRSAYPREFAQAGRELNLTIGTINTAVLLLSSYFMALAVHAARHDRRWKSARCLAGTVLLGIAFLGLKAYEYADDIAKHLVPARTGLDAAANPPVAKMLYFIYYGMTGLHALHLTIDISGVTVMLARTVFGRGFSSRYYAPLEVTGLYWHFVDVVWIFLYPLLYLMDRSS